MSIREVGYRDYVEFYIVCCENAAGHNEVEGRVDVWGVGYDCNAKRFVSYLIALNIG